MSEEDLSLNNQCKVTTISIKDFSIETVDIADLIKSGFTKWCESNEYSGFFEEVKDSFDAGNPQIGRPDLIKLLSNTKGIDHQLALFNPMLEVQHAAVHIQNRHKQLLAELLSQLNSVSISEFKVKCQELSEDEDFVNFLSYLQDSTFDEDVEWGYEDLAVPFLMDFYLILTSSLEEKENVLEEFFPETYQFITKLIQNRIAEPYLLWTVSDDGEEYFNRIAFNMEHDSRVLAATGNLSDPGAECALIYPDEFKPLSEVNPDYVYNIESGRLAITNKLISASKLSSIGFESETGMGDGYYPTIPFFDHLGELQMVTTFFTHMIDSEWLDSRLGEIFLDTYSHHLPIELGYLECDGSIYFGDSTWFHNGPGDDIILEFNDLPVDKYLVVRFIDVDAENRTWAVSVMRDKAKRNFEILFKIFPELTNRSDDF